MKHHCLRLIERHLQVTYAALVLRFLSNGRNDALRITLVLNIVVGTYFKDTAEIEY